MSDAAEEIDINRIRPGMVLASPAVDILGNTVFSAGLKITDQHIRTLKAWGVRIARVNREPESATHTPPPAIPTAINHLPSPAALPLAETTSLAVAQAVPMQGAQPASPPRVAISVGEIEAQVEELRHIFAAHNGNPLMQRILEIAERQLRRQRK